MIAPIAHCDLHREVDDMATPGLDRGFSGEQSMGFYWGERGYFIVDGPSGAGGHAANASGFDGVAFNPNTGHMVIYDNKAFARAGNVYSATAISDNLSTATTLRAGSESFTRGYHSGQR